MAVCWHGGARDRDRESKLRLRLRLQPGQPGANEASFLKSNVKNYLDCPKNIFHINKVRLLEGEQECYFKLFKPAVFKFGRKDCVPDQGKKVATYIYLIYLIFSDGHKNIFCR